MNRRISSIVASAAVAVAVLGGAVLGGAGTVHALVSSAVVLVPGGSTASGQGIVSPAANGASVTIAITGGRPNATFTVSACQSMNVLLSSTCTAATTNNTVTADGSGSINGTVTLPAIQELDSIVIQDRADASDVYYSVVGPNPPLVAPVVIGSGQTGLFNSFLELSSIAVPSSALPGGTCPDGITGFLLLNTGSGIIVVSCP